MDSGKIDLSGVLKLSITKLLHIYLGKTVLITGHTGFKGTWLSIWLESLGARVVGYSLEPSTQPSIFEETEMKNRLIHIIGDVKDEDHLTNVLKKYEPEFVFHLAAQPLVKTSFENPKLTFETNLMGVINLFEAIRQVDSTRVVINITSDKCYANKEWIWPYRENDSMGGYDPYSSSKGCSELITESYRQSFFNINDYDNHKTAVASVRSGNVIGGGDWSEHRIVPDCISALTANKKIKVRNPSAIRPWQHVLEPLSGYLWLGLLLRQDGPKYASAWNFGPNVNHSATVRDLVELLIQIWGEGSWISTHDSDKEPHEANYLTLDISKAYRLLQWFPLHDFSESLMETINWYKEFYTGNVDIYSVSLQQIKNYIGKANYNNCIWSPFLAIQS